MSSLRRILSPRANVARSRGPITAEGKERSSATTWAIDNRLMEKALRNQPPSDEAARIATPFTELATSSELNPLYRYETRLHRIYRRTLYNLALLREPELPKEPSPISGHQPREEGSNTSPVTIRRGAV